MKRHCTQAATWARRLAVLGLAVAATGSALRGQEGGTGEAPSAARAAGIWFHPLPSGPAWPHGPSAGSQDFLALFARNAAWPQAMAHVGVVGVYAGWITAVSDPVLRRTVAFLNAHHMGIEIEAPALQALATCGSGVEGYVPWGQSLDEFTLTYLRRLRAFGAQVSFVKVDEPFFFGSVTGDPRACRLALPEVAAAVGHFARLVKTVYPEAAVGDVEPIIQGAYPQDVVTAITLWHDVYQEVTGAPFPFFFADIDFSNPLWPAIVKTLETSARQRGMPFGIIYIGDPQDASDAEWASKAVARFQIYQGEYGGRPSYVLFQSWLPHPTFCLPETDPTTFTGVLDAYIHATTRTDAAADNDAGPTPTSFDPR